MKTFNFGKECGQAFSKALQLIYSGTSCKLERNSGNWLVIIKGEIK